MESQYMDPLLIDLPIFSFIITLLAGDKCCLCDRIDALKVSQSRHFFGHMNSHGILIDGTTIIVTKANICHLCQKPHGRKGRLMVHYQTKHRTEAVSLSSLGNKEYIEALGLSHLFTPPDYEISRTSMCNLIASKFIQFYNARAVDEQTNDGSFEPGLFNIYDDDFAFEPGPNDFIVQEVDAAADAPPNNMESDTVQDFGFEPGPNDFPADAHMDTDPIQTSVASAVNQVEAIKCQYCLGVFMTVRQRDRHEKACGKEPAYKPLNAVKISENMYAVRKIYKGLPFMCHVEVGESPFCSNQACRFLNVQGMNRCAHVIAALTCKSVATEMPLVLAEELTDQSILTKTGVEKVKNLIDLCPEGIPFLVELPSGTSTFRHFSIMDKERIYVHWQSPNKWACNCSDLGSSCPHILAGKWALYLVGKTSELKSSLEASDVSSQEKLAKYYLDNKQVPSNLFHGMHPEAELGNSAFILRPVENACPFCSGSLSEKPVRGQSYIVGLRVAAAAHVYMKHCSTCGIDLKYRESNQMIFNYDNHFLITYQLLKLWYYYLTGPSAVSISDSFNTWIAMNDYPNLGFDATQARNAFYSFMALLDQPLCLSCPICKDEPSIIILDGHVKCRFDIDKSKVVPVKPEYTGLVDHRAFWDQLKEDLIFRAETGKARNRPVDMGFWSPILNESAAKPMAKNSEYMKLTAASPEVVGVKTLENISIDDVNEMFSNMSKQDIINLFSRIGIKIENANITKGQLLEWAREKILENAVARSDLSIKKYFQSYYAASGDQILAFCAHGIIYGAKFLLGSEGSRDVLDLLLSFKKFPIVTLYDDAGNLAAHAKASLPPEQFPWPKFDGRVAESLDSLTEESVIPSEEHRVLGFDRFHQPNHKSISDKLRNVKFVKGAKRINSQVAEQSNSEDLPRTAYRNNMLPDLFMFDSMICYSRRNKEKSRKLAHLISEPVPFVADTSMDIDHENGQDEVEPMDLFWKDQIYGVDVFLPTIREEIKGWINSTNVPVEIDQYHVGIFLHNLKQQGKIDDFCDLLNTITEEIQIWSKDEESIWERWLKNIMKKFDS